METKLPAVEDFTEARRTRSRVLRASGEGSARGIISQMSTDSERIQGDLSQSGRKRSTTMGMGMKRLSKPIKEVHFENKEGKPAGESFLQDPRGSHTAQPRESLFLKQFQTDFLQPEKLRERGAHTSMRDEGKHHRKLSKHRYHDVDRMRDIGWGAIRSLRYTKKIDGPTMFQDQMDAEKPPWKFLHDQIMGPTHNHKYQTVLKKRQEEIQRMVNHSLMMEKQKKTSKASNRVSIGISLLSALGKGKGSLSFPSQRSVTTSNSKTPKMRRSIIGKQPSISGPSTFKQAAGEQKNSEHYMTIGSSDSKSGLKTVKEKADEFLETKESHEEKPKKYLTPNVHEEKGLTQTKFKLTVSNLDNLSSNSRSRKTDRRKGIIPIKDDAISSGKNDDAQARMRRGTQISMMSNLSHNSGSVNAFSKIQEFLKTKFKEKKVEQSLLSKVLNMQRPKPDIPDYIKNSPKWRWIERLNNDLHDVSAQYARYVEYLNKVKIQIKRDKEEFITMQREEAAQQEKLRKMSMTQEVLSTNSNKASPHLSNRLAKPKEQVIFKEAVSSRRKSEPNGAVPSRRSQRRSELQQTITPVEGGSSPSLFTLNQMVKRNSTVVMEEKERKPGFLTFQQPSSHEISENVSQERQKQEKPNKMTAISMFQERFFKSNNTSFITKENGQDSPDRADEKGLHVQPTIELRKQLNTQGGCMSRTLRRPLMAHTANVQRSPNKTELRLGTSPMQGQYQEEEGNISFRNYTEKGKTLDLRDCTTSVSQPFRPESPTRPVSFIRMFDDKRVKVNRRLRQIDTRLEQLESSIATRNQNIVNTASFLEEFSKSSKMEQSTFRKKAHNSVCYGPVPTLMVRRISKTPNLGNSIRCKEAMARVLNSRPYRQMPTQDEAMSSIRTENPLSMRSPTPKKEQV